MRRPLLLAALAALALPVTAAPAQAAISGSFFPGDPIDSGVTRVGDADLARDGAGGLVYTKPDAGADHVFVSRLVDGAFQPVERLDAAVPDAGSQPVIAAGDGGRLAVAFVSGGTVAAVVKPAADQPWTPVQPLAAGSDPAVDLSINGAAYVSFTAAGAGGHDIRAARMERRGATFQLLDGALDIVPAADAGTGAGRSRISVSADGSAVVTWGEAGHVFARRLFELRLSQAPQDVGAADAGDIGLEDDSSFGWDLVRQGASIVARRLLGSTFDPAVPVGAGDAISVPRLALASRGDGYAAFSTGGTAFAAVLKDDKWNPAVPLGSSVTGPVLPTIAQNGDGAVVYQQGPVVIGRLFDLVPQSRLATPPGPEANLARPELGAPDTGRGLVAAADRSSNLIFGFVQGDARTLVAAAFDRAPGSFGATTTTRFRNALRTPLSWHAANEAWGPLTYTVFIDGQAAAQSADTPRAALAAAPADGLHTWFVTATDRRGQVTRTRTRFLRLDSTPPKLKVGFQRRGRRVTVVAKPSDGTSRRTASGVRAVTIVWGDGSRALAARKGSHRYGGKGTSTLRVRATDQAGNVTEYTRRVSR